MTASDWLNGPDRFISVVVRYSVEHGLCFCPNGEDRGIFAVGKVGNHHRPGLWSIVLCYRVNDISKPCKCKNQRKYAQIDCGCRAKPEPKRHMIKDKS